jgi:hypothetical protein
MNWVIISIEADSTPTAKRFPYGLSGQHKYKAVERAQFRHKLASFEQIVRLCGGLSNGLQAMGMPATRRDRTSSLVSPT